jgi:hypothetical protein
LKNNYKEIFKDQSLFSKFDRLIRKNLNSGFFTEEELERIDESLLDNRQGYENFFNHLKNLVLYMQINEPQITIEEITLPNNSNQKD